MKFGWKINICILVGNVKKSCFRIWLIVLIIIIFVIWFVFVLFDEIVWGVGRVVLMMKN